MGNGKKLRAAILLPVLLAFLACPAGAASSRGKGNHYPGQKCIKCHQLRDKAAGRAPAITAPAAGATTGTGAAQTGKTPPKGAPKAK